MFKHDQEVLRSENKTLIDKLNANQVQNDHRERLRQLAMSVDSMIGKLDLISQLNEQAKRNDVFKEQLH